MRAIKSLSKIIFIALIYYTSIYAVPQYEKQIGQKETEVFGGKDETTTLEVLVRKNTGWPKENARVIIDNGIIADTLLTNVGGRATFTNSPVTDVKDDKGYVKNTGRITTTECPQVAQEKFTTYAYFGKDINKPNGTIIGEGKIYTMFPVEEVGTAPITVKDDIAIMHFDGSKLANAPYVYVMTTKYGVGKGKILKIDNGWEGAFNDINSGIVKELEVYKKENQTSPTQLQKTQATDITLKIESIKGDTPAIETIVDQFQIEVGDYLYKEYTTKLIASEVTYTIIAKDLNSEETLEGVEMELSRFEGEYTGTSDLNGEMNLENVAVGIYNLYIAPSENHYGVDGTEFYVDRPQTVADLTDTLYVYLWNKDRPLPGTDETRRPSLYEIKEMDAPVPNLQRALGVEVHNLNETGEQLERARNFYAHVDSMVFNGEWGITLKLNDRFEVSAPYAVTFTLDNIENYGYNVITNGGSNAETHPSGDIPVARAPLQNYTVNGNAFIGDFIENPEDPEEGKEIGFRLGKYGVVGSRISIGNATPSWFTETDRVLLYSYLKHERATLSNDNVVYYSVNNMTE